MIGKIALVIMMIINLVMMIRIKDLLFKKGISGGDTAGAGEGGGKAASRGVNQSICSHLLLFFFSLKHFMIVRWTG